jgi:phosphate transport system substrate-binding protein
MIKFNQIPALLLTVALPVIGFSQTKPSEKVLISGTKFTYPLVEKWIGEFKQAHPEVEIALLPKGSTEKATLAINAYKIPKEQLKENFDYINISRYALLPITNAHNPLNEDYLKKGLKESDVKSIFFENPDDLVSEQKNSKSKKNAFAPTIYTREQKSCAPITFANHFGFNQEDIQGKGITGDDKFLIQAVKKDSSGITYNNLGFIYDLNSRKVIDGISVIPFDLNENGKLETDENFYGSLDDVIKNLENSKTSVIPVEYVTMSFPKETVVQNAAAKLFLDYILSQGQQHNHQFGFLNLEEQHLAKQKEVLNNSSKDE